jgi:hypothetical protein
MKKGLLLSLIVLFAIGLIVLLRGAYSYYSFLKQPILPLTHAAPNETVVMLRSGSIAGFIEKSRASGLGEVLQAAGAEAEVSFNHMAAVVDSLSQRDVVFEEIFNQNPFILSVVAEQDASPGLLISVEIRGKSLHSLEKRILSAYNENQLLIADKIDKYPGVSRIESGEKSIWYYLENGIFTLGFDPGLVAQSLEALHSDHPLTMNKHFARLDDASGKKVDAVLFLRNDLLFRYSLTNKLLKNIRMDEFLHSWSALDMLIGKEKITLSGFTLADSSSWLAGQLPLNSGSNNKFPGEYTRAYSISLSNPDLYFTDEGLDDTLQFADRGRGSFNIFRIKDHLSSWMGNSASLLTEVKHGSQKSPLVLIDSRNADSTRNSLSPFINFAASPLPKIRVRGIFDRLFGEQFAREDSAYCMVVPNRFLLSPSSDLLLKYETLLETHSAKSSSQIPSGLINEKGNLLLYFSAADLYNELTASGDKPSMLWTSFLKACEHILLQYSGGDSMIYTQGSVVFNPLASTKGALAENRLPIDSLFIEADTTNAPAQGIEPEEDSKRSDIAIEGYAYAPVVLPGQKGGQKVVFVSDQEKVTVFDDKAKQLWQFRCKGKPGGGIFEVILPENGKRHYLIVTDAWFHLLGMDGKEVKNSPQKLPGGNSGTASLFDYDRKRDYRLIYPGKDGKVYNITLKGDELPDWSKPQNENLVQQPLFFRSMGKDYLMFLNAQGKLSITDRRGKSRIQVPDIFRQSLQAGVFENKTNSKGLFLSASKDGRLAYITAQGLISYSGFGDFGHNPWFEYLDFDGDNSMDFLFAGNGKVGIYSRMKKEILVYQKKGAEFGRPFIYSPSSGIQWIVIREKGSGNIIFFKDKNSKPSVLKLSSDTDPVIFNPGGRRPEILVTLKKGKLIYTELK